MQGPCTVCIGCIDSQCLTSVVVTKQIDLTITLRRSTYVSSSWIKTSRTLKYLSLYIQVAYVTTLTVRLQWRSRQTYTVIMPIGLVVKQWSKLDSVEHGAYDDRWSMIDALVMTFIMLLCKMTAKHFYYSNLRLMMLLIVAFVMTFMMFSYMMSVKQYC